MQRRYRHRDSYFTCVLTSAAFVLGTAFTVPATSQESGTARDLERYRQQGLQAAMQTQRALGGALMEAMKAGGAEGAVAFCNTQALPITAQMSTQLGVTVERVSDRPRNTANAANEEELAIISRFKDALATGEQPAPAIREHGDEVMGYYPIVTNGMCLQCHGVEDTDVSAATQAAIDSSYPDDRATGYGENELRGLFVVTMSQEDNRDEY